MFDSEGTSVTGHCTGTLNHTARWKQSHVVTTARIPVTVRLRYKKQLHSFSASAIKGTDRLLDVNRSPINVMIWLMHDSFA